MARIENSYEGTYNATKQRSTKPLLKNRLTNAYYIYKQYELILRRAYLKALCEANFMCINLVIFEIFYAFTKISM